MADLSDEEILHRALKSEPQLFAEIVSRYKAAFLRKAQVILKNEQQAEDAVQEAFVKIYIKGGRFKKVAGASFRSWAYKILINTCLTMYRTNSRVRTHLSAQQFDESLLFTPNTEWEKHVSRDEFLSVLSRLPSAVSSLLHRMVVLGRNSEDIAQEESVSVSVVRTRLHRARKAFEKIRLELI